MKKCNITDGETKQAFKLILPAYESPKMWDLRCANCGYTAEYFLKDSECAVQRCPNCERLLSKVPPHIRVKVAFVPYYDHNAHREISTERDYANHLASNNLERIDDERPEAINEVLATNEAKHQAAVEKAQEPLFDKMDRRIRDDLRNYGTYTHEQISKL